MLPRLFKSTNLVIISSVIACLALFLFVIAPTGVSHIDTEKVTKIYFADNISAAHQQVIDRFNETYRGAIEVIPVNLPFTKFSTNERKQLLTRSLRSKSTRIDIFAVDLVWVPRFVKWTEPLAKYFSPQEQADFVSNALQACFFENELVSVPLYFDTGIMYYRQDLLRSLADYDEIEQKLKKFITWEEFIRLSRRFAHRNLPFYLFPADSYEGLVCCFVETVSSLNASLIKGDTLWVNTPQARKALQLLVDLVGRYHVTPSVVTAYKEIDVYQYALQNDAIFFRGWSGNLRTYQNDYGEKIREIGVTAIPHFSGAKPAAVFGGWNLMISKDSGKKAEAVKFIKFATSKEIQQIIYEEMGYLPANRRVYEDSAFFGRHPELKYFRRLLETGVHRPASVEYTKISDILSFYINKAIKKEISVERALQSAEEMIHSQKVLIN